MNKISIIGAGMTGSTTAHWLAERELAAIVLVDILEGMPQGKALDMQESMPIIGKDVSIVGSNSYEETAGSDIVVITSGLPRKPGMSRDDLIKTNAEIVKDVTEKTFALSPDAIFIVLTNPLDAMCQVVKDTTNLPRERVIGQAGILDSARMRAFVAMETGVSVENINCYVLGGHGDTMVPLTRHSNVAGIPLDQHIPEERLAAIVERTRKGDGEIVGLLKTGSAFYAPSAAIAQMCEAILKDKNLIVPASVFLQGEYGVDNLFFGVPAQLNRQGVAQVHVYELNDAEMNEIKQSADHVKANVEKLAELIA